MQGDGHKYSHTHSQIFSPLFRDKLSLLFSWLLFVFTPPHCCCRRCLRRHPICHWIPKWEKTIVKIVSYQYIPNWNYLLFNWVLSWWHCVTYCFSLEPNNIQYFKQSIQLWNNMSYSTYIGIQYWNNVLNRNKYNLHTYVMTWYKPRILHT